MIVVADTSLLNYLVLLGHIEILAKIYAEVVVPQAVLDELQDSDAPAEVRAWFSAPPRWLQVCTLDFRRKVPKWKCLFSNSYDSIRVIAFSTG